MKIRNYRDFLRYLGVRSQKEAEHYVRRYSDCGALLLFTEAGIAVVVPMEDAEFGAEQHELTYPFDSAAYERYMQALEDDEAAPRKLVNDANRGKDRQATNTEIKRSGPALDASYE